MSSCSFRNCIMILLGEEMAGVGDEGVAKVETHYSEGNSVCAEAVIVRGNMNCSRGIVR